MPKGLGSTLLKLLIASLVVGLVLSWLDIRPQDILKDFGATIERIYHLFAGFVSWAGRYILLGAVVVVPLWLIFFGLDLLKGRGK
jgi:peptidoglycan biosynthesis protein MviN/MurJ (putative lipid II flippase)